MLDMFISLFPILITTICLLCKKNSLLSLLIGSVVGIVIFEIQCRFSLESIAKIKDVIFITIMDNITVLISIFFLFFLVFLITYSKVIIHLNNILDGYICDSLHIIIILLILGMIFSLDDYLLCMATAMILSDIAMKQGFSKEKITYLINITSVSLCCISPISSWMPVIKHTLKVSGLNESIIYQTILYNFTAILGIIIVIIVGLFRPSAFKSELKKNKLIEKKNTHQNRTKLSSEIFAFCILCIVLIGSLVFMTLIIPCTNAVIKSSILSLFIGIPLFIKTNAIDKHQILLCIKDSIESIWDLSRLLVLIWLLTNVCKILLNMDITVANYASMTSFPTSCLPAAMFFISGIFAFFTGSSYGTFGLFIPIAVQLTSKIQCYNIQIITIASTISGSLMASSSFTSDTLKITSKNTKGNIEYIRFAQLPYGLAQFISSFFCFYFAGLLAPYGRIYSSIIPFFVISCLWISYLIICPLVYDIYEKKSEILFKYVIGNMIYNMQIQTNTIYSVYKHTFHSLYKEIENSIQTKIKLILKSISIIHNRTYPLKMPGL